MDTKYCGDLVRELARLVMLQNDIVQRPPDVGPLSGDWRRTIRYDTSRSESDLDNSRS